MAIRAEADIAVRARTGRSEADLAEAGARGAALVARMQSFFDQVQAERPFFAPRVAASLATCEAEISRLVGTPDPDRWAAAAAGWGMLGIPDEQGYALMREGEAALAQRRDRPRAARALMEAREIATRLGAVPLLRDVEALANRAGIALEPPASPTAPSRAEAAPERIGAVTRIPYDLTKREREVLALVAAGRSDGEIAEALFISKKTASFHVAMIKSKLGARSRVEIATDAIGLGVIEAPTPGGRASA
jgi:DNA-binding CsgD family transcriptional regulator